MQSYLWFKDCVWKGYVALSISHASPASAIASYLREKKSNARVDARIDIWSVWAAFSQFYIRDETKGVSLAYQQSSATFAAGNPRTRGSSMPRESPEHAKGNRPEVTNSWVDTIYRFYLHKQETWHKSVERKLWRLKNSTLFERESPFSRKALTLSRIFSDNIAYFFLRK